MKRDHCGARIFFKWIAGLTLQTFILSNLFFTSPAEIFAQEFPISIPARSSEAFLKIPSEFGKFDGLFKPFSGNQTVFFFHIKDAHASAEAQKNIARILMRLHERKQLDLVLVEGAAGPLIPERLDVFEDPQKNAAYKEDLFSSGLLNGAAYFIATQKNASFYGLEDPRAYSDHLQIFRRVVDARPGTGKFFNTVEVLLMNTFKNILQMDVFVFLKEWKMQHQRELSWGHYLPFLIKSAEKFLGLDLQDYHMQARWPNLVRFRHLDLLQDQIHPEMVQKEFQKVSRILETEKDPALRQAMTLLSATIESPAGMLREMPDFRKYVEILVDACRREGVLLQQYPNLVRYLAVRIFRSEIEPEGLLAEAERLEEAIFDKLFAKGKMREILSAYRDFFILKRAFGLDLDRAESKRFLAMDIEKKIRQFSKIAPGCDLQEEQVIHGANLVKRFYTAAQKRDGVFMKQVKNSLHKAQVFPDRPFYIALVTGGYHAEGIENWFRAERLPFASIQPSFKDEPNTDRYEKLLMGDYRTTDALAAAQGSIEPDATAEKLMGRGAFLALREAEVKLMAKHGAVRSQNTPSAKAAQTGNRKELFPAHNLAGRSEIRSSKSKGIFRWCSALMLAVAIAGLFSGCTTIRHDALKVAIKNAEAYTLPRPAIAVPATIRVDAQPLLQKIIENDPLVKKAEIGIAIQEIEKDKLKGSWAIVSDVAVVDGKPVFSVGVKGTIPNVIQGGITGFGVGSLATLALDFASSLGSVLRGEPLLARTLAQKVSEIAQLNHQRVIGERYVHYAGIALEIKELQAFYETDQKAIQALEAALAVSQGRAEVSELERMKIRNMQSEWRLKADEHRSALKAKEALLLNLYAPGATAETQFVIDLKENALPPNWKDDLGLIGRLRYDATHKEGAQLPPNRELAVAYKGREATVIVRELEHARGRFSLGFEGFGFLDNLGSTSDMSSSTKADLGTAWDPGLDRRTKDRTAVGLKGEIPFGKSVDVKERISAKNVEITESILTNVQRTVEDDISGLVYRIGENQDKIKTLTGELQRLESDIRRARQAQVAGRRLVTEDKLAEYVSAAWKCQMGLIEARAETSKAILELETIAGVLGDLSWRNTGNSRSEVRTAHKIGSARKAAFSSWKLFVGAMLLFFSLMMGACTTGPSLKGPVSGTVAGTELKGETTYEMYDGFTSRILNTIPEGGGKEDLQRFAQILRVTIVSEETLRQAQLLFVREVMHVQDTGRSGSGVVNVPASVAAPHGEVTAKVPASARPSALFRKAVTAVAVSGPSTIGANVVDAVKTESQAGLKPAEVDQAATALSQKTLFQEAPAEKPVEAISPSKTSAALTALDEQLGRAVPGFKKLLKNPKADSAAVNGYRQSVLNAILTARPVDPKSFQEVFFNWDNPFHSAWTHRDAMERSVAKKRVVVNPVFRDRISALASQAGMLTEVTESQPAAKVTQGEPLRTKGAVSGPVGVAAHIASFFAHLVNPPPKPAVESPNPVSRQPQVPSLAPGPTGVDQLPAPVSQKQPAGFSPVIQILLNDSSASGPTGVDQLPAPVSQQQSADSSSVMQILLNDSSKVAEIPHQSEVPDSVLSKPVTPVDPTLPEIPGEQQPAPTPTVSAPLVSPAIPSAQTASPVTRVTPQLIAKRAGVSTAFGSNVTRSQPVTPNATKALLPVGTVVASRAKSPSVSKTSPGSSAVVPMTENGSVDGHVFTGRTSVNPVLLNIPAGVSGIPEYAVREGDTVPRGGMLLKITDPENAGRIRALETEMALIDAQLADKSLNAGEYAELQFKRESLARELLERNYQERLRTLKAFHPFKVVKLTRGQVNQGEVAVQGVELDAGQIAFRLPLEYADFDDAKLQVDGEIVRALRYDLSDFDPLSGQFLLTIDFVSPSGAGHGSQAAYTLKLGRRHAQEASDLPLGKGKPFRVMVPRREPIPVTIPVAPGIPGGVFYALVPEGTIVSAGTPIGTIDASGYQQKQLDAAKELRKLVGEISAANQNFAAFSPEELRRLNAEAALRIASLEGVNPKLVVRAPVDGRIEGLIPVEGQPVVPGKATRIRVLSSLVFLGSTDLANSNHMIDVPKGSVREGERILVRTPLGGVLEGTVFKVLPLADENGLWLSDRDSLMVQVEDPAGQLSENMPVEVWTGVSSSEKGNTPASRSNLAMLPIHYGGDLPPAVLYQLLRHPDQKLSGSVRSVLSGEGSFRQILSSWKFFFESPKGLVSFGDMIRTGLLFALGTIISLWAGIKIMSFIKRKLKWLNPDARLSDLAFETRELQIRLEQKGQAQDRELLEDVITSINEWIRILSDEKKLDHESLSTILIKAQELAGNKNLSFSKMKFQDLGMWKDAIGDDLAAIYEILTVLSILTARRIAAESKKGSSKAPMELHEFHRFQQGIVDYGDIFNESYTLAHHLIGLSQTMDLYPPKLVRGSRPFSVFEGLKILHNRLVRFLYPVVRIWLWVSPVVFLHKLDTVRSYRSLSKKMETLGLKTPEDTQRDVRSAKKGLNYALNSEVTVNQPAGSKMAMHSGRFWRRFLTILAISSLFLPTVVLTFLGLHWLTATVLMSIGRIILPIATIGFHIIPILNKFHGKNYNGWKHELSRLRRQNARKEDSLPEIPKPQPVPKKNKATAMPRQGSEQIAMSKVLNALHEGAQDHDLEVVALVPPQYGENKAELEQFIQSDDILRRWTITVAESDGEFPGDAGLFYAARNIAKSGRKNFKIYWYPRADMDFQTALAVFKINLGEAARMVADLRAAGVRFGEVAFPGGDLTSSSVGITRNGGHFVVQARHASLNEIERERLPAILGRNGTSRLEIEQVLYDSQKLRQVMAAGPLRLGSGRVDLGNTALPQIPVPTGPIAIVAETPEDRQTIQELLDHADDKVRNLMGRFGPFRINFLEDIVRPVAELSRQVAKSSATPPNPNLLVNRTVRLSDDSVVNPYDKLYTAVSRFLWNGGNGNRRNLKAEAFIPPVSETVYVPGEDRQKLAQVLGRVGADFPELVDQGLSQKLRQEGPAEAKAKLVFRDNAGQPVLERKKTGYQRGLRSVDVAGFVTKDQKLLLQRRNHQIGNEPGRLDMSFAGHQDETDNDAEAAARREFHEELFAGRNPIPPGLIFHAAGPEVQLDITHEGEKGLSIRKKSTAVFRVSLNGNFSWDDFLPGDNAVEIVGLTREELETALRETPGLFTARAFQLLTKLGTELAFSEPGSEPFPGPGPASRSEHRSSVGPSSASRSELRIHTSPSAIPFLGTTAASFDETKVSPQFKAAVEIRILAAIVISEKILAVRDAGLLSRLEASLEDTGTVSERVAPALAALAGAHEIPVEVLKARLEFLLRQEQLKNPADDRVVFLDAGTVPAEYFRKLMDSPVPVVILFDRRHKTLYEQALKERPPFNRTGNVFPVYTPDGVSSFIRGSLRSVAPLLSASPRLNGILTRFRSQGKADDIALITSNRAESQKIEQDYVGHRYYFTGETLRLDPELVGYSLALLLRSPELFRYGKGRYAQDVILLIGLVLQQLAQEFQASLKTGSAV